MNYKQEGAAVIYLLIALLFLPVYTLSMDPEKEDKDTLSDDSPLFTTMFSNLFPGRDEETVDQPKKVVLPIKQVIITNDEKPLLKQCKMSVSKAIRKNIKLITSSFAYKDNLEVINPYMLIFGKSGTGKSTLAKAIAYQMQKKTYWDMYKLKSTDLATQFQNSGPQNLKAIVQDLLDKEKGSVLIIEDINGFYPQYQSGDTNDSGANAIAFWQFLDRIKNNPKKHVLLLITESNTKMPIQIKERFIGQMIKLKSLKKKRIKNYLSFILKSQDYKPRSKDLINECITEMSTLPKLSYAMLNRMAQQAIRDSSSFAFDHDKSYAFRLKNLLHIVKKQHKSPDHKVLKMDKPYESEPERLHKKQIKQKKKLDKKQRGLALLQLSLSYKQAKQQLLFNGGTDKGGLPNYGQEDPEEFLTKKQYKMYKKIFDEGQANTRSLLPKSLKSEKNKRAMKNAFKKFKKESK